MNNRVLVALSGGLDSAAVVLMLRERGYLVEALYIDMLGDDQARMRAVELADRLGVKLHVEDVRKRFKREIIDFVLSEHQRGRTPSPCARCNPLIKWRVLAQVADSISIPLIATGHYVRTVEHGGQHFVASGIDPAKDQSYYLWALDEDILSRALTPLGDFLKTDVRKYLLDRGFEALASGGESMGLCFLSKTSYRDFLCSNLPIRAGKVVDSHGDHVGSHDGFQLYTVGQKRGFVSDVRGEIRRVDARANTIEVGDPIFAGRLYGDNCVWRGEQSLSLWAKVRGLGRNPKGRASIELSESPSYGLTMIVSLHDDRAWAPCVGQPVVLYDGDRVVGGAVLYDAEPSGC